MAWLGDWSKRIKLTVDNTNVDDTLSNFPVLIKLSNSSGITSTDVTSVFTELGFDANRKKIAVTTSNGTTQCYVEIERFDYSNSVAWLWIKVPSISSGAETALYFYYDNSKSDNTSYIGDTGDTPAQSVWDTSFKLVMHMAQDPNGDVADAIKDSTSNANHGTPGGSMTSADLVDGKVGKGIDFDGGDDLINCGSGADLEPGTGEFTVESTIKTIDTTIRQAIAGKQNQGGAYEGWTFRISQTGNDKKLYLMLREDNSHYIARRGNTLLQNAIEYNATFTYDGSELASGVLFYLDGSRETESTEQDTLAATVSSAVNMHICSGGDVANQCHGGITDEIRISNIARSAAWIKTTYYSNWDELISFGSEETESVNYISGYVKEGTIPINRQIYLHNRDTGALITSTTSSGAGGYFYLETTYSGAHYVVCLDDVAGADYNDLIYGNIYPATTSG